MKTRHLKPGQGDSDAKVLLAQGLAIQKAELVAAMVFIGAVFTDLRPSEWMEAVHALPDPV